MEKPNYEKSAFCLPSFGEELSHGRPIFLTPHMQMSALSIYRLALASLHLLPCICWLGIMEAERWVRMGVEMGDWVNLTLLWHRCIFLEKLEVQHGKDQRESLQIDKFLPPVHGILRQRNGKERGQMQAFRGQIVESHAGLLTRSSTGHSISSGSDSALRL